MMMRVAHYCVLVSSCVVVLLCVWAGAHQRIDRHQGHTHYQPKKDGSKNLLKDKGYVRDYELHDLNSDMRLDGLELLAAINHVMNRQDEISLEDLQNNPQVKDSLQNWWNGKFQEDAQYIDEMLREEDLDQDGFLSYSEFALARQKERDQ